MYPLLFLNLFTNQLNQIIMSEQQNQPTPGVGMNLPPNPENIQEVGTPILPTLEPIVPLQPSIPTTLITEAKAVKDPEAFKKNYVGVGKITVRPFIIPNRENMGLENYDMVVFPGIIHEEQVAALETNGIVRFITGLNEFAPEVQSLKEGEEKTSIIYNIRSIVSYLEKMLMTNIIDVEDPKFWDKVKLVRPDNVTFWSTIRIRCGNEPVTLEPNKDPYDLIKLLAIEAGGFDIIAKSQDDALARQVPPKFYLDKEINTISSKTTYKKIRNKAISILDSTANSSTVKLLYITKALTVNSMNYKTSTPTDVLYDVLDDYINGLGLDSNKLKAAEKFMETAKLDMETLKLKAIVKDAAFYRAIVAKPDGMFYHTATNTMLGRNVSDVVLYLKNPTNEDILMKLMSEVEPYWV